MREIKFRVFDTNFKKMLPLHEAKFVDGRMIGAKGINWDSKVIVMQWTGLHDKNGKEIYEFDVLKREAETGVVRWDDLLGRFRVYMDDNNPMPRNYSLWFELIEVIGNIYENPELAGRTE